MRNYTGELNEVKKGQTGYGLLIEHDGHITGHKDVIDQIKEDMAHHDRFVIPDDFVVSAVFQKYGIKNANGRIYPENVLKREVQKYIENQIREHRAIGALDHPSCVKSPDTQVLTALGWKKIIDINVGDEVLTINEQKKIEPKKVTRTIDEPYSGKMIHFKGRFIDITVTPNHKFPVLDCHEKWKGFYAAQDILENNIPDQSHSYLLNVFECDDLSALSELSEEDIKNILQSRAKNIVLSKKSLTVTEEDYDGHVYCLEVEDNHTFYMMDDSGHCLWSGNSSTLSGHDVTHNILDLRWEGRTLVGEMKLHLSPGYKRYGICSTSGDLVANMILDGIQVGVSSRAVGSVEQKMGTLIVGDDLELIGWDVVMEPSTSNAWISTNPSDLQPFIETKEKSNDNLISEKIQKISHILKN